MDHETARRLSQLLSEYAGDADGDGVDVDAVMLDDEAGTLTASQSFDRLAERFPSGERDVLQDKVFELEQRVLAAEIRAQQAEAKYRSLVHGESSVSRLQALVQEQMELRAADARQVETKAARIKEWVGGKLRELETANQALRDELQAVRARSAPAAPLAEVPRALPVSAMPRCEETTHDYAEIYTPCREQPWDPPAWDQPCEGGGSEAEPPPPTPPLHRFPSWESRIYRVADHGLAGGAALEEPIGCAAGYQDLPVPVYAAVKGRASQIRSVPFSGDSTDSSDGEDVPANSSSSSERRANGTAALGSSSSSLSEYAGGAGGDAGSTTASVASSLPTEEGDKAGPLAQLGGRLKTWRRRHAELSQGVLSLFRREGDASARLRVPLSERCRVTRAPGAATFTLEAPPPPPAPAGVPSNGVVAAPRQTATKVAYLAADSAAAAEDWVRALNGALRSLSARSQPPPAISGWATRVRNGRSRRVWLSLAGKTLMYFRTPQDSRPLGQVNMREARATPLDDASDSDSDDSQRGAAQLTVGVLPRDGPATYLRVASRAERDQWLYQLAVVSGLADAAEGGTEFEQLVLKLMDLDGEPGCVLWRHPTLLHTKECITSPLTTLPEHLHSEATKLFKCCQLFMSAPLHAAGIDYHVALAQNALAQALATAELQAELLCALVKLTSRPATPRATGVQQLLLCATQSLFACETLTALDAGSPTSTHAPSPAEPALVQGWQLLALAVSLFLPRSSRLLWLLKIHLQRNTDTRTECGKYAAYCLRALDRTLANGGRETKPSRMEVLSLLLKNPFHHSLPHAMPVHLLSGAYQVAGFDGSTTVREFECALARELGTRQPAASGFALFSDDPIDRGLEHSLHPQDKLCDVISRWETALREKGCGKFETSRVIQLSFKRRMSWRRSWRGETERERLLLCYQTSQQAVQGRLPVSRELAQELAALMAQIDLGEYNSERARGSGGATQPALLVLDKFFPYRYKDGATPTQIKELELGLQERWEALKGQSAADCARIYLTCVRKWPMFGASLYQAAMKAASPPVVWLAVSEDGVSLLELAAMTPMRRIAYGNVVTFGGCQDDFMLVYHDDGRTHKLVLVLAKHRILEVTLLVADYMNALGHALPPGTPLMGSLTRRNDGTLELP